MKKIRLDVKKLFIIACPLLMGIFAFLLVVGPRALSPSNLAWFNRGGSVIQDFAIGYVGWLFFRHAHWAFPLGLNPAYGLELSSSIIYSDSNPLMALLFKLFSPWLPEVFQYFGFWLLTCFVLQAWFSWKLLGLISNSTALRVLGVGLFVFAPPMIWRLFGHLNLFAHFLIIAALYIFFAPGIHKRKLAWGALLAVTALVHAYFLPMVGLIWLADIANKTIKTKLSIQNAILEFVTIFMVVCLVCWQAGYFTVGGGGMSSGGYGLYSMNLLSIFNPSGWSYILKNIPEAPGQYEGFNFLGLGVIFLLISAFRLIISGSTGFWQSIRRYPILVIVLIALTLFAISNKIGFGLWGFEYPLPEQVLKAANIFRASGRMFWPAFYMIVFSTFFLIVRGYEKRTAALLLSLALVMQIADTHAAWGGIHNNMMAESKSNTQLTNPIWEEFALKYTKIRLIFPGNCVQLPPENNVQIPAPLWLTFATYAATHALATDAVYVTRFNPLVMAQLQNKAVESLRTGRYETDSLYILDDDAVIQAALNINAENDALGKIDGFNVLAPGWKKQKDRPAFPNEATRSDLLPTFKLGKRMSFNQSQPHHLALLGKGWSVSEKWGTWSDGSEAIIFLPFHAEEVTSLEIEARSFVAPTLPQQVIVIFINGIHAGDITFTEESKKTFQINIPKNARKIGVNKDLVLELRFPNATRPKDVVDSDDLRKLALGLISIIAY